MLVTAIMIDFLTFGLVYADGLKCTSILTEDRFLLKSIFHRSGKFARKLASSSAQKDKTSVGSGGCRGCSRKYFKNPSYFDCRLNRLSFQDSEESSLRLHSLPW